MANITIGVINPAETEKVTMQVPNDVPVGYVTEAMVEAMGLPVRVEDGRRLRYHLSARDQNGNLERLDDKQTLEENEVQDGDVLQLTVEMVAGCFLGSVKVTLANGQKKMIEDVRVGDLLLSGIPGTNVLTVAEVSQVFKGASYSHLALNDTLRITESHPTWANGKWIKAGELKIGDLLQDQAGRNVELRKIERQNGYAQIFNLYLSSVEHTFFVEDLLVHNMLLKESFALLNEIAKIGVSREEYQLLRGMVEELDAKLIAQREDLWALEERIAGVESKLAEAAEAFDGISDTLRRRHQVVIVSSQKTAGISSLSGRDIIPQEEMKALTREKRVLTRLQMDQQIEAFGEAEQRELIESIAQHTGISKEEIGLVYVILGSVLVTLEMPEDAALKLMKLYLHGSPMISELGINKVELRPVLPTATPVPQLTAQSSGSKSDIDYEYGLQRMHELLIEQPTHLQSEFHTLEARLLDYLKDERWFGMSEIVREGRARVISSLNDLAVRAKLGVSFVDLCKRQ